MKSLRFFSPRVWAVCFLAAGLALSGLTGCKDKKEDADTVSIGFIYVGPKDDYGYNQAHAEGAAAVKKMAKVKIVEEEKVAETVDVEKAMASMIELGKVKIIFPSSFGYFKHVLKMA